MPNANCLTVLIMVMVVDEKRRMFSKLIKKTLAARQAPGRRLGGTWGDLPAVGY
jgi:hypothetical protein